MNVKLPGRNNLFSRVTIGCNCTESFQMSTIHYYETGSGIKLGALN